MELHPLYYSPPHPALSPLLGGEEKGEGGNLSAAQRSIIYAKVNKYG